MITRTRCHFIGIATPQDDAAKRVTFCRETILEDEAGVMLGKALTQPADLVVPFMPDLAAVASDYANTLPISVRGPMVRECQAAIKALEAEPEKAAE